MRSVKVSLVEQMRRSLRVRLKGIARLVCMAFWKILKFGANRDNIGLDTAIQRVKDSLSNACMDSLDAYIFL